MNRDLHYEIVKPDKAIEDFVDSFWFLHNESETDKEVIILPDGRVDLIFTKTPENSYKTTLLGIGTFPDKAILTSKISMFVISFKLPSVEYIFKNSISSLLDSALNLSSDWQGIKAEDLNNFDLFRRRATEIIKSLLPDEMDKRKRNLFELIYTSNGDMTINELSERVFWTSRQINRYFNKHYGLSLKSYCSILRFRASFKQIKNGKLYPPEGFSDQSHFIKEIKKLAGALPKELKQNKNDRFIQFSTLPKK